jgi:hypothetical protein
LVSFWGTHICYANSTSYSLYNLTQGDFKELFPHGGRRNQPRIVSAGNGEFLLKLVNQRSKTTWNWEIKYIYVDLVLGETIGVFISSSGEASRPTVHWSSPPFLLGRS